MPNLDIRDPGVHEDLRKTISLGEIALRVVIRDHPDDWREVIRSTHPGEFASATVDDYLDAVKRTEDRLF